MVVGSDNNRTKTLKHSDYYYRNIDEVRAANRKKSIVSCLNLGQNCGKISKKLAQCNPTTTQFMRT